MGPQNIVDSSRDTIVAAQTTAIVVFSMQGDQRFGPEVDPLDTALSGILTTLSSRGEITGKAREIVVVHTGVVTGAQNIAAQHVIVAGVGKPETVSGELVRQVAGVAAKTLRRLKTETVAVAIPMSVPATISLDTPTMVQACTEGIALALYQFTLYKKPSTDETPWELKTCRFVLATDEPSTAAQAAARAGAIVADGVNLARDLVNEPPRALTPRVLARRCADMAAANGLAYTEIGPAQMAELGMGALLGVAQGSPEEPRLIVLRYTPAEPADDKPHLGLIGKGITFDTGGISLKPGADMHLMKGDMAGGAAVIGAMQAIARLKPDLRVTGIIAASENMPSGTAMVPGDILRAMDGTTIEVQNTDAEGRLVLADAACYAQSIGLGPLIDVATLTGACVVALGPFYSGVFCNDDNLAMQINQAAQQGGERMWRMPLDDDYNDLLKSDCADLRNIGGREGGAITGAMFIKHFIQSTPWAHMDIAPTFYSQKDEGYQSKGATGVATRTLIHLTTLIAADQTANLSRT